MSTIQDLQVWNKKKEGIFLRENKAFPKERQIWLCKLGVNIGREQNGGLKNFSRPVLVFKQFGENFFILPLTSQLKGNVFRYLLDSEKIGLSKKSEVMLDQLRTVSTKRMIWQIGWCNFQDFEQIKNRMSKLILFRSEDK